jgi:hypothetical protein
MSKRSRALTRPKDRGRPTTCDIFDLAVTATDSEITITLSTDLPIGTRVAISAERIFPDTKGHQWFWTALEQNIAVSAQSGGLRGVNITVCIADLDAKGFNMYRELKKQTGISIGALPGDALEVSAEAPTSPHRFGICNRRLTGNAVTVHASGHSLEHSITLLVPFSHLVAARLGL